MQVRASLGMDDQSRATGFHEALGLSGVAVDTFHAHHLTALMWAAGQGHAGTVQKLLALGAKPELRDDRGLSAVDIARQSGHAEVAALLTGR